MARVIQFGGRVLRPIKMQSFVFLNGDFETVFFDYFVYFF